MMAWVIACTRNRAMGCTRRKVTGSRGKMPSILGKRPLVRENLTKRGGWLAMKRDFCLKKERETERG